MKNITINNTIIPPYMYNVQEPAHWISIISSPSPKFNLLHKPIITIYIYDNSDVSSRGIVKPRDETAIDTKFNTFIIIQNIYLWVHKLETTTINNITNTNYQMYNNIILYHDKTNTNYNIYHLNLKNEHHNLDKYFDKINRKSNTQQDYYISSTLNNTISDIQLSLLNHNKPTKHTILCNNNYQLQPYDILPNNDGNLIHLQYKDIDLNLIPIKIGEYIPHFSTTQISFKHQYE